MSISQGHPPAASAPHKAKGSPEVFVIKVYQRKPRGMDILGTFHSITLGTTCRFHNEQELLVLIQGAMEATP